MGFQPKTDSLRVRRSTHCAQPPHSTLHYTWITSHIQDLTLECILKWSLKGFDFDVEGCMETFALKFVLARKSQVFCIHRPWNCYLHNQYRLVGGLTVLKIFCFLRTHHLPSLFLKVWYPYPLLTPPDSKL